MSLIDTPGHNDFSEDTYRALIAADSVVMVIDAANGVEQQTRKLFEVCRRHRLPILTFINKFDRPARDPLELLDDLERTLGISRRAGELADRQRRTFPRRLRLCSQASAALRARGARAVPRAGGRVVARRSGRAGDGWRRAYAHFRESLDVIREAGTSFDAGEYRAGRQTPVFFGSALTNFGLEPFLQALVELAPPPQARASDTGDRRARPTSASPGSCSRFRRTWTRGIAIAWRSCACAPAGSTKDMVVSNSRVGEADSGVARLPVLRPRPRDDRAWPTPATSSASSTPASSPLATRCTPARRCGFPTCRDFRRSISDACGCATRATSNSTRACGSSRKRA